MWGVGIWRHWNGLSWKCGKTSYKLPDADTVSISLFPCCYFLDAVAISRLSSLPCVCVYLCVACGVPFSLQKTTWSLSPNAVPIFAINSSCRVSFINSLLISSSEAPFQKPQDHFENLHHKPILFKLLIEAANYSPIKAKYSPYSTQHRTRMNTFEDFVQSKMRKLPKQTWRDFPIAQQPLWPCKIELQNATESSKEVQPRSFPIKVEVLNY